jgi:hypothetical protein
VKGERERGKDDDHGEYARGVELGLRLHPTIIPLDRAGIPA